MEFDEEVTSRIENNEPEFYFFKGDNCYRFIHKNYIYDILKKELRDSLYMLGKVASSLPIEYYYSGLEEIVPYLKFKNKYDILGEMVEDKVEQIIEDYVDAKGVCHFFTLKGEVQFELENYYVFLREYHLQ